jgi:transposase
MIFMQDHAPIHTDLIIKDWLEMAIEVLQWPPYLPDLKPIERAWSS